MAIDLGDSKPASKEVEYIETPEGMTRWFNDRNCEGSLPVVHGFSQIVIILIQS